MRGTPVATLAGALECRWPGLAEEVNFCFFQIWSVSNEGETETGSGNGESRTFKVTELDIAG